VSDFLHHEVLRTVHQLYRDPRTDELNERIRLFPCSRNAESHRPVSKCKKSCGGNTESFPGSFSGESALPPLPAYAKQIPGDQRRAFTRCWCQSSETSRVFSDFPRKTRERKIKGFPGTRSDPGVFLHSKSSWRILRK